MCRRVDCSKCGKPTFAGCGMHVEAVLGDVRPENRCRCKEETRSAKAGDADPSFLRRLFGG